jgi:hypothetical protein
MNQASTMTALAAVVVSCGLGFAQQPPSTNPTADKTVTHGTTKDGVPKALVEGSAPDVSGAPVPETAGQARLRRSMVWQRHRSITTTASLVFAQHSCGFPRKNR